MNEERRNIEERFDEQLVAYLDGELDSRGSREVEELLASNPDVRRRLQDLERSWEMLGELDATPVKENFARTTLEMVAVEAEKDLAAEEAVAPKKRRYAIAWAGVVAATLCVVGFFVGSTFMPSQNSKLLRDLSVIEKVDQYRQVGDVEFLRMLHKEALFQKDEKK